MKQYAELNDTVYFWFPANNTSGSGGDGANPAADIRLAGSAAGAAPVLSPTPVLLSHASYPAGCFEVAIAATSGNGFAAGQTYAVFSTLLIDGQNPTGFVGAFDLKPVLSDNEDILALLGSVGNIFYVSKSGDNSDGTSMAKAMNTIDAAVALCTPNNGDEILVDAGVYDETANGPSGIICDVEGVRINGLLPGVVVKNTDTNDNGRVFSINATNVWVHNLFATKGEVTSEGSIVADVSNSGISADIRDVTIAVEKESHTGIRFTGGAVGSGYINGPMKLAYIYSVAGVGTGIEAANCNNCVSIGGQFHTLGTGIKLTGGANCHDNMLTPDAMISSCGVGISLDAGAYNNMLSAMILNCTTEYADNSGNDTNKKEGSLTYVLSDIRAAIVESAPQVHLATSDSTVTHGSVASGSYSDTNTENDIYWRINPDVVDALDMYSQFSIGVGRTPSHVDFNGRFQGHPQRYCDVYAWNYDVSVWEKISSDSNRIDHATSDFDRQFALTSSHAKTTDGEVKICLVSTSTTIGDDLYIDKMVVDSVAQAAGGLTADAVATTVWNRDVNTFTGAHTSGSRLRRLVAVGGEVSVSDTAISFMMSSGTAADDAYNNMPIRVGCLAVGTCETRRIKTWTAGRVLVLDRPLSFTPQVGDLVRIMNQYCDVDIGAIEGADPSDVIKAQCGAAIVEYNPPTRSEATEDKEEIIEEVGVVQAKTDGLPSGVAKNQLLPSPDIYMVLSSDHTTPAIGKVVAGMIRKDTGAFVSITNAITEVGDGLYTIVDGLTQEEMNADKVSLKFTADDCDQIIIVIWPT